MSEADEIKAAVTLARSSTVTAAFAMVLRWIVMLGVPVLTGLGGWGAAKLDTKDDLADLQRAVNTLTEQQKLTIERIDALVPAINAQIDGVQRTVVVVGGAALAYESERNAKAKLKAGDDLAVVYDAQRKAGETPANSAMVLRTVSLPHSR